MNIFKKIGAAALTAALMAGTAVTASAEELVKVTGPNYSDDFEMGNPRDYYYQYGDLKIYPSIMMPFMNVEPLSEESKANLVDVVVPVTESDGVGYVNFENCPNLKTLTIMDLSLREPTFYLDGCPNLTDIYFNVSEADLPEYWAEYLAEKFENMNITVHYNSTGPDGSSAPSKPSGSTGSGTATTPSTSTDKDNPDSGVGGIALAIGTAALAGAAVVISRKRK